MLELLRQCRRRTATRLGVALASVWFLFAAVPCNALEQAGLDLGHMHAAPAAVADAAAEHDCPHCPASQPAAATPGDCVGLDEAVVTKVTGLDLVLAVSRALPVVAPSVAEHIVAPIARGHDRPPSVPLNLRFCTFLE